MKRLYRSKKDKIIAGVCGGLAEYFEVDPTIVRLVFVITLFAGGTGLLAYIIALIVMPEEPMNNSYYNSTDHHVPVRKNNEKNRIIFGGILILIGVAFLFEKYFYWFDFSYLWPVALIIVGCLIIFRERK